MASVDLSGFNFNDIFCGFDKRCRRNRNRNLPEIGTGLDFGFLSSNQEQDNTKPLVMGGIVLLTFLLIFFILFFTLNKNGKAKSSK